MSTGRNKTFSLLAVIFLIAASGSAQIQIVTYSNTVTGGVANNPVVLTLPKFNSQGGLYSLTAVSVHIQRVFVDAAVKWTKQPDSGPMSGRLNWSRNQIQIAENSGQNLGFQAFSQTNNVTAEFPLPYGFDYSDGPEDPSEVNVDLLPLEILTLQTQSPASSSWISFASEDGLGTIDFTVRNFLNSSANSGSAQFSTSGSANTTMSVTYQFVPEPSSASLLIAGTIGLLALSRRRKL